MDTKPMTAERLAEIVTAVKNAREGRLVQNQTIFQLSHAGELLSEVHRLRAVKERAEVLHEAVRAQRQRFKAPWYHCRCTTHAGETLRWKLTEPERHAPHCPAAPSFLEDGT